MMLSTVYGAVRRLAAPSLLLLVLASFCSAVLGGDLALWTTSTTLVLVGWAVAAVAVMVLVLARLGLGSQSLLWVLTFAGASVAYGGLKGSALARPLTGLAVLVAVAMAVVAVLLRADESLAEPRSRF